MISILAIWFLGEQIALLRWLAIGMGLVGVIVVLRVSFGIEDIAFRIVVPLVERLDVLDQLADDVVAGLGQHTVTVDNVLSGRSHRPEAIGRQIGKVDIDVDIG